MGSALPQFALFLAVVTRPTYRALTAGRPERVKAWAAAQGLEVTADNEAMLTAHLRRSGRCRAAGALAGLAFAILVPEHEVRVYQAPRPGGNIGFVSLWAVSLGYLAGSLAGELGGRRPSGVPRPNRTASLSPRELYDYVPPVARRWLATGAAATVAAATAFLLLPMSDSRAFGRAVVAVVPSAVAVALALAAPRLARMLVLRPQPVGTPSAVAADDALRSLGARAVVAAGVVTVFLSLGVELFALTLTDVRFLRGTAWVPALGTLGFAYGAWRALVEPGSWRVRRNVVGERGA